MNYKLYLQQLLYHKYKLLNYIKKKDDLNIKIQEQSILNKIYVIERNLKVGDMKIKSIDKSKLTKKMILNEKMEFDIAPTHTFSGINNYNFQSLINAYLIINYNSLIVNFWIMYKKLIQDIIKTNIKLFYIYMPKEYDSKYGIQLYQHLRGKKND